MAEKHPIKDFLTVYEEELGYDLPAAGKEARGAKRIMDMGYSIDDAMSCYRHYKSQSFWQDKHVSLMYVASNIKAWDLGRKTVPSNIDNDKLDEWYKRNN